MTRKEALEELIAKVEAGGEDTPEFSALVSRPIMQCKAGEAYRGSLDAAKALHEAVLPGWDWEVASTDAAAVFSGHRISGPSFLDAAQSPARAWLLVILRALLDQEPSE